jgi:hypothetical protein
MFAIYIHLLFDLNNKRRGCSEKSMVHVLTILFQEIEKKITIIRSMRWIQEYSRYQELEKVQQILE